MSTIKPIPATRTGLSDAQQRAASLLVQRHANDAEDEAMLLAILGLLPAPDPTAPGGQR